ncbi:hypothetical protein DH2020_015753 [Rehmannia glutinosa]|uniref:DNA topoisomerase n=1 Tax=Rehmannia glutinosa TaxID=99300 RepID=A0ABR0WV42_REHGL
MAGGGGRPLRALNVAEKPSVAKAVSGILSKTPSSGGLRVRDGRSRYNRIFEFNYTIQNQQVHMSFTSVTGHLMELDFEDRYRKWHSCDPVDLYHAPVKKYVPEDKSEIEKTLEEEARKCQWLILWLDCDREGENIAFEVVEVCTRANRNLNIWRARLSALIDREIHYSVQHLVRPNQLFSDAVDVDKNLNVMQEIDLRIGASFTRFQTMLLRDAFVLDFATNNTNVILSYGPCQFPTLGFIVERRGHLFDYTCAMIIYEMCVQEPTATVTNVRQQEKLKYPPHPLSTIELEKRASRYFRMSSEHTMKISSPSNALSGTMKLYYLAFLVSLKLSFGKLAEDLYQAGFISYPRTETDCFSVRTDLHTIVQEQQGHPVWGSYAQRLLDPEASLWRNPSGGGHDDKAHPPIHPTKFSAGESGWSPDHHVVYELVVRHFLACVSQPAIGAETTVEIDIAGEQFSASGRVIIAFTPTTLTLDAGVTRPPPLLSEADLLSCMDKGEALVMGYDDMGYELWKPYLRAMMESDMKAVSMGTKRKAEVLEACLQQMKACFVDARLNKGKLFEAMAVFFERSNRSNSNEQHAIGEVVRKCGHMGIISTVPMDIETSMSSNWMEISWLGAWASLRNVVWLPGSVSEAIVTTNICSTCSPGCIGGCDDILRQLVEVCGTGSRNNSSVPGRGQGPTSSSSSAQQSGFRSQGAWQTGHSSGSYANAPESSRGRNSRSQEAGKQDGESSIPCSSCGAPCNLRTANTLANRGRKFYSCQAQGCNFFVWEDNASSGGTVPRGSISRSASNPSRRGGRGRSNRSGGRTNGVSFMSATGEPISGRCFVCGDPGHFANACPNRGRCSRLLTEKLIYVAVTLPCSSIKDAMIITYAINEL